MTKRRHNGRTTPKGGGKPRWESWDEAKVEASVGKQDAEAWLIVKMRPTEADSDVLATVIDIWTPTPTHALHMIQVLITIGDKLMADLDAAESMGHDLLSLPDSKKGL